MDFQELLRAITWYCQLYEHIRPADLNGDGAWVRLEKYARVISNGYCRQFYYCSTEREKAEFIHCFDAWRRGDIPVS